MGLEQKYTEARSRVRKVIISVDFFEKLEMEDELVMETIMTALEQMRNEIRGHMSLALTFNDVKDTPRFIVFKFIELNEREIKLYEYQDISSDMYLDMMLDGELLQTSDSIDTFINY
tara:strand:+ start:245 stop:595 length:351 start_codon:yes stop_codon:yes gene_type:complete